MGAFAPPSSDRAIDHFEIFISDMVNGKLAPWAMQAFEGADLLALVKTKNSGSIIADHILVVVPDTITKVADKAVLKEFENAYK